MTKEESHKATLYFLNTIDEVKLYHYNSKYLDKNGLKNLRAWMLLAIHLMDFPKKIAFLKLVMRNYLFLHCIVRCHALFPISNQLRNS